ncbi:MAG: GGDEF domain-containing protein [Selenomonadaceae bacterium]|nr:GGDEF domain-containing protein [Selenomonadaceae bacterium]
MQQFIFTIDDLTEIEDKLSPIRAYIDRHKTKSVLVHCFCGRWVMDDAAQIVTEIKRVLPQSEIIGTISYGEVVQGESTRMSYALTVTIFTETQVEVLSYLVKRGEEKAVGEAVSAAIAADPDNAAAEIFSTVLQFDNQLLLESIALPSEDFSVFGAGAMGAVKKGECFIIANEEIITSGLVVALYKGRDFHVHIERISGWKPMGPTMDVTKVEGLLLKEIDGAPAFGIYQHYLQIPYAENFLEHTLGFPMLSLDRGYDVLRVSHGAKEDGSIILSAPVQAGTKLRLTYGNLSEIYHEVEVGHEKIRRFVPQGILLFDCATRLMYWQTGINQETAPFERLAPTAGIFCEGEFRSVATKEIINHQCTLVAVGMREGPPGKPVERAAKLEEMKFYTDSSVLKRMAAFIQMTSLDLEKANQQLTELNVQLNVANAKLSYIAVTDELTKLFNRREIEHRFQTALKETAESADLMSLIMIDIDFFKRVNDTYGHAIGDKVLQEAATVIHDTLGEFPGALAGRWGGEEFLAILPEMNLQAATKVAETIRQNFAAHEFKVAGHQTMSLGVTCTDGREDEKKIFIRADDALYRAKGAGRNRVVSIDIGG